MDDYISKPFRAQRLKEVLLAAVGAKAVVAQSANEQGTFSEYLYSLDPDDREDVLAAAEIFRQTISRDIAKLKAALTAGDFGGVYFVAHTLKSVVGIFGRVQTAQLAEALERACEREASVEVRSAAGKLLDALDLLTTEIEAELG
jgi:HPt (histidine-containing phosphotransfer) domain-containing protein